MESLCAAFARPVPQVKGFKASSCRNVQASRSCAPLPLAIAKSTRDRRHVNSALATSSCRQALFPARPLSQESECSSFYGEKLTLPRSPSKPSLVSETWQHLQVFCKQQRWKPRSRRRRNGDKESAFAPLAVLTGLIGAAFAAGIAMPIVAALVGAFAVATAAVIFALFTVSTIFVIPATLLFLSVLGAAIAIVPGIAFVVTSSVDSFICQVALLNCLVAAVSFFSKGRSKNVQGSETLSYELSWDLPSILSIVPGINGLSWITAMSESSEFLSWPKRVSYVMNSFLYGLPGFVLFGNYFLLPTWRFQALFALKGWWLALVLGAIHLQIERLVLLRDAASTAEALGGEPPGRMQVENKLSEEEDEVLLRTSELEEFDARLRQRPAVISSDSPADWSTGDVLDWLKKEGFARYTSAFVDHDVDGPVLLSLSANEIRDELGIKALGDRKRLSEAIQRLRGGG